MILSSVNKSLELVLGSSVTTQVYCTVSYKDINKTTQALINVDTQVTRSNNTTAVTILDAPATDVIRVVSYISIKAVEESEVIVSFNDNSVLYEQVKHTLSADQAIGYTDTSNWKVLNAEVNMTEPVTYVTEKITNLSVNVANDETVSDEITQLPHIFLGITFKDSSGTTVTPSGGTYSLYVETVNNPGVFQNVPDAQGVDATAALETWSVAANITQVRVDSFSITDADNITLAISANAS